METRHFIEYIFVSKILEIFALLVFEEKTYFVLPFYIIVVQFQAPEPRSFLSRLWILTVASLSACS